MAKKLPLTANERKELIKQKQKQKIEVEEKKHKPLNKKMLTVIISLSLVIVLLISFSIVLLVRGENLDTNNPVAVIKLTNGMTLEYELEYDSAPVTVSSFVYLSQHGFYDGTVIHQIKNGYVEGGQYRRYKSTSDKTDVYKDDTTYKYSIKNEGDISKRNISSFGNLSTSLTYNGARAMSYFRLTASDEASEYQIYGTVFGVARGDKTRENLRKLNQTETNPTDYSPNVTITVKSITIKFNDKKKWKNYDFYSDHTLNEDYYLI